MHPVGGVHLYVHVYIHVYRSWYIVFYDVIAYMYMYMYMYIVGVKQTYRSWMCDIITCIYSGFCFSALGGVATHSSM